MKRVLCPTPYTHAHVNFQRGCVGWISMGNTAPGRRESRTAPTSLEDSLEPCRGRGGKRCSLSADGRSCSARPAHWPPAPRPSPRTSSLAPVSPDLLCTQHHARDGPDLISSSCCPTAHEAGITTVLQLRRRGSGQLVILQGHSAAPECVLFSLGPISTRMQGCGGGDI